MMKFNRSAIPALGTALALTASLSAPALAAGPSTGIAVQLDGKNVPFTDAAPEVSANRTFLPMRAVLEAMGATVDYDAAQKLITATRGGTKLEMVLGAKEATITESGKTRTMKMDVAAYAKNNRTYVPVRFTAEAFGCNVGWDQDDKTVIIVDTDKLLDGAEFTLMDNYAAYSAKKVGDKNQTVKGTLTGDMTVDKAASGADADVKVSFGATFDAVSSQTAGQIKLSLDLSGILDAAGTDADLDADTAALLNAMKESLKNVDMELRMNMETGKFYLSCPALASLMGVEDDTWFEVDLESMMASSGVDMGGLMEVVSSSTGTDMKESLTGVLSSIALNDKDSAYEELSDMAALYTGMLSDSAFTKKGSDYVSTVSSTQDGLAVSYTTTLKTTGSDVTGMALDMTMKGETDGEKVDTALKMSVDSTKMTMTMKFAMAGMTMDIDLKADLGTTTTAPVTTLPAGAKTVDLGSAFVDELE